MRITAETKVVVSLFDDIAARTKVEKVLTLGDLADLIRSTNRNGPTVDEAKATLPWLKLAAFGNARTPKGSRRFDKNVLSISGAEIDYDREEMSFDDAVELLEKAGLGALIYTSPSFAAERPRWRILAPTSANLAPERRAALVARLNGVIRGGAAAESAKLSQSYYFGSTNNNPLHQVEIIEGEAIDELDELDLIAIEVVTATGASRRKNAARGGSSPELPGDHHPSPLGPLAGDALDVFAALAVIDNPPVEDWERWNYILMATHAATAGSLAGYAAIVEWSKKAGADIFDLDVTKKRWQAISDDPTVRGDLGFGTLLRIARESWAGFERPSEMRARRRQDPGEPPPRLVDPEIPVDDVVTSKANGHDPAAGNGHDTETAWGAPRAEEPWPEIEAEAFDGVAGDIVRAIENETEADPVALLITLLVMIGNMLGRVPHALVGRVVHHLNLFAVFVGATARGRKGTSEADVTSILGAADSDWALKIESGLSSGEGVIWRVHDEIRTREKISVKGEKPQYVDVIKEANVEDKRLMIVEPEFAGTLAVMKRDGSILSRVLRDAWDGRRLATLTKNSNTHATGAHISMIAHITSDDLRASLDRVSLFNGFANRFLFACVKRAGVLPFGGAVADGVITNLADRLREMCDTATALRRPITFDKEAAPMWAAEYRTSLSIDRPGLLGAVTARAEAHTLRLASLFAALDSSIYISRRHLLAALAVWRYCEASARYTFGDAIGDPFADELLIELRKVGAGGLTRAELYNLWGRNRSSEDIGKALRLLLKHDKVQRRERPSSSGRGRPAEIWAAI